MLILAMLAMMLKLVLFGDDVVNNDVIDVNNNVCAVDNYGVGVSCG